MFPWLAIGALITAVIATGCGGESSTEEARETNTNRDPKASETPKPEISQPAATASPTIPISPCPADMVAIEGYCIDRYEAALTVDGIPHPSNLLPPANANYQAISKPGIPPQAYISRDESERACRQARKRLCSLNEWFRACSGPEKWNYPYGNQEARGKCNTGKQHLMSLVFGGTDPMTWGYLTHFNNPNLDATPGFLAKTGEYQGCVGTEGVHDMVGNLHEWVADAVDWSLAAKIHLAPRLAEDLSVNNGHGIFMGGYFSTGNEFGFGCHYATIGHEAAYHDYSTGFRCCADQYSR